MDAPCCVCSVIWQHMNEPLVFWHSAVWHPKLQAYLFFFCIILRTWSRSIHCASAQRIRNVHFGDVMS